MIDLRLPSGLFFTLLGVILIGVGILSPGLNPGLLTDANVNLYSGIPMLLFGLFLLLMAKRASGRKAS
jgi:hypothetical protein